MAWHVLKLKSPGACAHSDPTKPKAPLNPYMFYYLEQKATGNFSDQHVTNITKLLAEQWADMSDADKKVRLFTLQLPSLGGNLICNSTTTLYRNTSSAPKRTDRDGTRR